MPYVISPIGENHNVAGFSCRKPPLNSFLKNHALKNANRNLGRTYVLTEDGSDIVIGYYTLTTSAVSKVTAPQSEQYPYPFISTVLLARFAVHENYQGQGLGKLLLIGALRICYEASRNVGVSMVDVLAKDEEAKSFYAHFGFQELKDDPLHLYMSTGTVEKLITSN